MLPTGSIDPALLAAVTLLVVGIVGSAIPSMPGPLVSVAGVAGYWWFADGLGTVAAVALVLVGLFAVAADQLADVVSTRASGASWTTTALAGVAGLVLMFVAGPIGIILGVAGTVFAVELYQKGDRNHAARAATYTTVGILASIVVQVLLTVSMLAGFLVAVLL
ncbi:DUF456 domain-containing protein [Haloarchaeobius amylolyticus]|uniref:DUF456 domain-containing protein n=1 Tax=Haloarchaeobius amylolyticus TaxID=1198296 RepID=UPI002270A7AC|nr:DUF456 domain-containing protein [Haloarchaeobius amylolyticus]